MAKRTRIKSGANWGLSSFVYYPKPKPYGRRGGKAIGKVITSRPVYRKRKRH